MSANNLENECQNNVDFWEIGGFKANVYRIRDGFEQLEDLSKLLKERVDIEDKYGKSLQGWSQKWQNYAERNFPDGIIKDCLYDVLMEGKEVSRIHSSVKDRLSDEVVKTVGAFKESSYHRSAIRGLKEQRDIEEKFEKAQGRWKKLWKKLDQAKKYYHNCCRAERSAHVQMINSRVDLTQVQSSDIVEKSQDRHERCCEETKKAKQIYEERLNEVLYENTAYVDKMSCVFEECQQFEFVRMKFVIEMISGMQKVFVDLVAPPKLQSVHNNLEAKFKSLADVQLKQDLKNWSHKYGTDVPHQVPIFEKIAPEFHNITSKFSDPPQDSGVILTKKKILKSDSIDASSECRLNRHMGNILLDDKPLTNCANLIRRGKGLAPDQNVGLIMNEERSRSLQSSKADPIPAYGEVKHLTPVANNPITVKQQTSDPLADPFLMPTPKKTVDESSRKSENKPPPYHIYTANKLKFKESDKPSVVNSVVINAQKEDIQKNILNERQTQTHVISNVSDQTNENNAIEFSVEKVVALFDYKPNEADEIALVKGEVIEMFRSADDMGWCYGRKNDKIGFFPAGYVSKCS